MRKSDAFSTLTRQFHLAGILLTRLPFWHLPQDSFKQGTRAVWAYPIIGAVVGILGAAVASLALWFGQHTGIAAGLALASMMLVTGAMHEDGLADTFDGFWGGQDPARRLAIMRDSHIGTYGVLALVTVTGLRWIAITLLLDHSASPSHGLWALVAASAASRGVMPMLMANLPHARQNGLSHSVGAPTMPGGITAFAIGCAIAFFALGFASIWPLICVFVLTVAISAIARLKIEGQTGDVLGAAQQLSEVLILLLLVA